MNKGFTLVEVLVSLVISGVLISGVYSAFETQQKSYVVQEQVAEMQQNIRAGIDVMVADLRMAGFNLSTNETATATITSAEIDAISFAADFNGDGDTSDNGENLGYDLYPFDGSVPTIGRATNNTVIAMTEESTGHYEVTGHEPFLFNVDGLEFYYQLSDDTKSTNPADPGDIRSIQISVLVKAAHPDPAYNNNDIYTTASGASWGPYNDNFRRRFQTMTVDCRNMGL